MPSVAPLEKQPRIIELGAIAVEPNGTVFGELSQLLNPGIQISEEITKITGIKNEDLVGKPTFAEFLPRLEEFVAGCDLIICHNAPFDMGMLRFDLRRCGAEKTFPWPAEILCTAQEYAHLLSERPGLIHLYKAVFGRELAQTHRAVEDCRALLEVLMADKFFEKIGLA